LPCSVGTAFWIRKRSSGPRDNIAPGASPAVGNSFTILPSQLPVTIPGVARLAGTIGASFAATGRGWAHPMSTCRWPASWKEGRWPEIQEARCVGLWRASAMAWDPGAQGANPMTRLGPADPERGGSSQRDGKSPGAGAERQPLMGRATAPLYRLRSRHSRTRRTLAGAADEATGAGAPARSLVQAGARTRSGERPRDREFEKGETVTGELGWRQLGWRQGPIALLGWRPIESAGASGRAPPPGGLADNRHRECRMTKGAVPRPRSRSGSGRTARE